MSATPSPRLTARVRAMRRDRIFARLLEGQAAAAIAAEGGGRRVRQILVAGTESGRRRWN